ncbi:MAG: hypothetical protein FWE57_02215 [Chitinispirillia bacterium]|nr:hypothetical protein [Chitinispirillia bacterium]
MPKNSSYHLLKPLKLLILAALITAMPLKAGGENFEPRLFSRGNFLYIVEPQRIVFLSMDTRTSYSLYSAPIPQLSIVSVVQSGDRIWAANKAGAVMSVNMQTGTVEEWGRGNAGREGGHIDVDRRFLWRASDDTLYRMELSSGEWISIPINSNASDIHGVISFNDQIHVISSHAVHILRTAAEDWTTVPHDRFTLGSGEFRVFERAGYFIEGNRFYRYDPSKRLWSRSQIRDSIVSVDFNNHNITVAARNRTYNFNSAALTLEPHPVIPALRNIRSITMLHAHALCALDRGFVTYNSKDMALSNSNFDFNFVQYPDHVRVTDDVSVFTFGDHFILYTNNSFVIHNHNRRLWSSVRIQNRDRENIKERGWTEEGAVAYSANDYMSTLHGTVTVSVTKEAHKQGSNPVQVMPFDVEQGNTALNLHTADADGRILDITLDNGMSAGRPPQDGIYYRGIEGDIINRVSYGEHSSSGLASNQVVPDFHSKGVNARFTSRTKTEGRDRSFLTASAGSAGVISKVQWTAFRYIPSGIYQISSNDDRLRIIPESVKMYVDGTELFGTDYRYDPASQRVILLRRDKADPASIIQIGYSVKIHPEPGSGFELFPENHIGHYDYAEGTVSPRSWLSARAGVMTIHRGSAYLGRGGGRWPDPDGVPLENTVILAGLPVEWRDAEAGRTFLLHPEIAYDNVWGAHSGGLNLGVRENRAFGSYRGFWASRDFWGVEQPRSAATTSTKQINGARADQEHDIDFGYDLRDDLRVGWRQLHRERAQDSVSISMFELHSLYTGNLSPDIEMSVSRRYFEKEAHMPNRERKESFNLRLSDMSSSYLNKVSGIHNVGYDFSLTEYRTDDEQNGRTVYGWGSISPTNKLTLTPSGMYRLNPSGYHIRRELSPSLTVNTRDLPAGFDMEASYLIYHYENNGGSGDNIETLRSISTFFYPGNYVTAFDKFAIYLGYDQHMGTYDIIGKSSARYAFLPNKNDWLSTKETGGLIFFPTENLLLSTVNSRRTWNVRSSPEYSTNERIKYWFESGSSVEANLEATRTSDHHLHIAGSSMYEHRWEGGLITGVGAHGSRYSYHNYISIAGGPGLIVSSTKDLSGYIRSREMSHSLWVTVETKERFGPDLDYAFQLRLKIPPDISIAGDIGAAYRGQHRRTNGYGRLYLHAGF